MQLDFAFLCDYADAGNKINALGIGFDTIFAKEAPAMHPLFFVVVQLRASAAEVGNQPFTLHLIDADGANVMDPIQASLNIAPPPAGVRENIARLAIRLNNINFPKFSDYAVRVLIQGREVASLPIRVAKTPPQ